MALNFGKLVILTSIAVLSPPQGALAKSSDPTIDPMTLIPEGDQHVGQDREIGYGEAILTGRIVYSRIAKAAVADFKLLGMNLRTGPEMPLRGAQLPVTDKRIPAGAPLYCSNRFAAPQTKDRTADSWRFSQRIRVCLADFDSNAKFDHAFVVGAKYPAEQKAFAIDDVPFVEEQNAAIPGAGRYALVYDKRDGLIGDSMINPKVDLLNGEMILAAIRPLDRKRETSGHDTTSANPMGMPYQKKFGDCVITFLGKTQPGNRLKYRIDHPLSAANVSVQVIINGYPYKEIYYFD